MGQNIHLNISQNMNPATVVQQGPLSMTGKFTVTPQTTMIAPSTPGVTSVMGVIPSTPQSSIPPNTAVNRGGTPTIYNWISVNAKPNQTSQQPPQ